MSNTTKTASATLLVKAVGDERKVTFVVSSGGTDRDYERVDVKSLRLPLKGGGYVAAKDLAGQTVDIPWLLNHSFDVEDVIGSVRGASYDSINDELIFEFGVSKRAKAQDMLILIEEGHLDNAVSITMSDYQYDDSTKTIYDAEMLEVSLVFRGSNKEARLLAVKSLIKGETMADATLEQKKADIERLQKEVDAAEAPAETPVVANEFPEDSIELVKEQAPVETEVEAEVELPAETEEEQKPEVEEVEAPAETEPEVEAPHETKSSKKETTEMSESISTKQIVPKAVDDAPVMDFVTKNVDDNEIRKIFVDQFIAAKSNDHKAMAEANTKAMGLRGVTSETNSKALTYANGAALYQDEVVANDILKAYSQYGNVGRLVNRVDILGATTWKRPVEANGTGFQPVGIAGTKDEDKPVWTSMTVTPHEWAVIVAWYDRMARETPLAVYNLVIDYIARMYAKLEDEIILTYAGATVDSEVFESTGLVPALEAATRVVAVDGYPAGLVATGLGNAYGLIESDGVTTIVANRKTWGKLAVSVDGDGNTVFNVVGDKVFAGALGQINVVVSQAMPNEKAVMGVFGDYDLVTRGRLEQLFSREATVGSFNLYTQDGSAVRSNIDISGKAARLNSFVVLNFTDTV